MNFDIPPKESAEKTDFDKLMEETKRLRLSLEPNYTLARTTEDEKKARQDSMRGRYWESGDPKKMAFFQINRLEADLQHLKSTMETVENFDKKWQAPEDPDNKMSSWRMEALKELHKVETNVKPAWKKEWREMRKKYLNQVTPILKNLGLEIPQTSKEVEDLIPKILTPENLSKLQKILESESEKK